MLIVETADMLQAPLFTAEALLRAHGTIKLTHTQSHTCRVSACPYNDWHWQRPGSLVLKTNVICTQHSRFDSGLVPLLHVAFFSPCVFYVSTRLLSNKGKNARKKKKRHRILRFRAAHQYCLLNRDVLSEILKCFFYFIHLVSTKSLPLLSKLYFTVYLVRKHLLLNLSCILFGWGIQRLYLI